MIECGSLEYAQARLQARHGERVDETTWGRLEVLRDTVPLLELARSTALRPWLVGITGASTGHEVDTTLRAHWRHTVDEVAGWMPRSWQPAVLWWACWPDLPALQHVALGQTPAAWMLGDARWQAWLGAAAPAAARPAASGPLTALAAATPQQLAQAWAAEWHRRWPGTDAAAREGLAQLVQLLAQHQRLFAGAAVGQGWPQRAALRARLMRLLRQATLQPAAVFVHLLLCALDLERLRAELQRRVLFPQWRAA